MGRNPPVASAGIEIPTPRSAFSFPRLYAFDDAMNAVTSPGEGTNTLTLAQNTQASDTEEKSSPHSPPQRQLMTYLHTKDRLQALFRSWKYHEKHEEGHINASLSFTIPLSPNPFTLLRHAKLPSLDWDVPSPPWTHHLLQYQKTHLRMKYKRMTRTRVRLMHAIRSGKSMGGEHKEAHIHSPKE